MRERIKSTPQDEVILRDETASPVDRASAATKLTADGFGKEIFPVLEQWLNHPNFLLRGKAVWIVLSGFGHQKYVNKAIKMLHEDEHSIVRARASKALSDFVEEYKEGDKYKNQILKELLVSLLNDSDDFVQRDSYQGLYKIIKKNRLRDDKDDFDRNRDVDWSLLQPYLEKYNLTKSA